MAECFRKISTGDCSHWFREFLAHWENMLEPEPTEPPLNAPDNDQSASIQLIEWIIPLIFTCFVLIGFIIMKLRKKSGTTAAVPSSDVSSLDQEKVEMLDQPLVEKTDP